MKEPSSQLTICGLARIKCVIIKVRIKAVKECNFCVQLCKIVVVHGRDFLLFPALSFLNLVALLVLREWLRGLCRDVASTFVVTRFQRPQMCKNHDVIILEVLLPGLDIVYCIQSPGARQNSRSFLICDNVQRELSRQNLTGIVRHCLLQAFKLVVRCGKLQNLR
jgi:hypothetical protein